MLEPDARADFYLKLLQRRALARYMSHMRVEYDEFVERVLFSAESAARAYALVATDPNAQLIIDGISGPLPQPRALDVIALERADAQQLLSAQVFEAIVERYWRVNATAQRLLAEMHH